MKKYYLSPVAEVWNVLPCSMLCVSTEDVALNGLTNEGVTDSGESFLW